MPTKKLYDRTIPTRAERVRVEYAAQNDSVPFYRKQVDKGVPGALKNVERQRKKYTPGHDEFGFPRKPGDTRKLNYSRSSGYKNGGKVVGKKK